METSLQIPAMTSLLSTLTAKKWHFRLTRFITIFVRRIQIFKILKIPIDVIHTLASLLGLYGREFAWDGRTCLCEINEGKYFPVQTEQTKLIKNVLYSFWLIFFPVFNQLCSSSDVAIYLTSELVSFPSCLHRYRYSFTSHIDKQLSRKATLMFQAVFFKKT